MSNIRREVPTRTRLLLGAGGVGLVLCGWFFVTSGATVDEIHEATGIDVWFLRNMREIVEEESALRASGPQGGDTLLRAKKLGLSDHQLGHLG